VLPSISPCRYWRKSQNFAITFSILHRFSLFPLSSCSSLCEERRSSCNVNLMTQVCQWSNSVIVTCTPFVTFIVHRVYTAMFCLKLIIIIIIIHMYWNCSFAFPGTSYFFLGVIHTETIRYYIPIIGTCIDLYPRLRDSHSGADEELRLLRIYAVSIDG